TAASASASESPAIIPATPAGRNHVQRRAVAPKKATTATRAALQKASGTAEPVGSAVVNATAAAAATATVTPNAIVRERRAARRMGRRDATDMELSKLGHSGCAEPIRPRGRNLVTLATVSRRPRRAGPPRTSWP